MKKKIILLVILLALVLGLSACKKTSQVDLEQVEAEIQAVLVDQEKLSTEVAKLADQAQIEEALAKNTLLKKNLNKALELNQIVIDNVGEDKKELFVKRQEFFLINLEMFNKMEECLGYLNEDKEAFEKCQTEFIAVSEKLAEKGEELEDLNTN